MRILSTLLLLSSTLVLQLGCKEPEPYYTIVAVYPSKQQCGVKEQMMVCGEVATYLRDTLKLKTDREIVVSAVGSDPLPKDDPGLDMIADTITAAGFKNVRTSRFDLH